MQGAAVEVNTRTTGHESTQTRMIEPGPFSFPLYVTHDWTSRLAGSHVDGFLRRALTLVGPSYQQAAFLKSVAGTRGALTGVALGLRFIGKPGGPYAAMMANFIYIAVILVGATIVYVEERKGRRAWSC